MTSTVSPKQKRKERKSRHRNNTNEEGKNQQYFWMQE